MCIRDSGEAAVATPDRPGEGAALATEQLGLEQALGQGPAAVSYTHLRAHETVLDLVCRLLLEKKNKHNQLEGT